MNRISLVEINFEFYKGGILEEAKRLSKRLQELLNFSKYKGENSYFNHLFRFLKKNRNNVYSFLENIYEVIYIDYINNPINLDENEYLKDNDVILLLNDIKEDVINTLNKYKTHIGSL